MKKTLVAGEDEYLYAVYSAFCVEETIWTGPTYQIVLSVALDNKAEDKNLPLAPWY